MFQTFVNGNTCGANGENQRRKIYSCGWTIIVRLCSSRTRVIEWTFTKASAMESAFLTCAVSSWFFSALKSSTASINGSVLVRAHLYLHDWSLWVSFTDTEFYFPHLTRLNFNRPFSPLNVPLNPDREFIDSNNDSGEKDTQITEVRWFISTKPCTFSQ